MKIKVSLTERIWGKTPHLTIFSIPGRDGNFEGMAEKGCENLGGIILFALEKKPKFQQWLLKIVGDYLSRDKETRTKFVKHIYNQD